MMFDNLPIDSFYSATLFTVCAFLFSAPNYTFSISNFSSQPGVGNGNVGKRAKKLLNSCFVLTRF